MTRAVARLEAFSRLSCTVVGLRFAFVNEPEFLALLLFPAISFLGEQRWLWRR